MNGNSKSGRSRICPHPGQGSKNVNIQEIREAEVYTVISVSASEAKQSRRIPGQVCD